MSDKLKKGVVFALAIMTTFAFTPFLFLDPDANRQQQQQERIAQPEQQAENTEPISTSSIIATSTQE